MKLPKRRLSLADWPLVRIILVIIPLLMAGRFLVVALWAKPTGPGILHTLSIYRFSFVVAAALSVVWAVVSASRMMLSAYLGSVLALLCVYQGIAVLSNKGDIGNYVFRALVYWVSFAIISITTTMLSIRYNIVNSESAYDKAASISSH